MSSVVPSGWSTKWVTNPFKFTEDDDRPMFITGKVLDYDALFYLMNKQYSPSKVRELATSIPRLSLNYNHKRGHIGKVVRAWVQAGSVGLDIWAEVEIYPVSTQVEPGDAEFQKWLISEVVAKRIRYFSMGLKFKNDKAIEATTGRKVPIDLPDLEGVELSLVEDPGRPLEVFTEIAYSGMR
jgi:hypothetical protein